MSSIAENINHIIRESTCEVIIHPGVSCGRNVADQFLPILWNNAKFFIPIIFIPYLLKFKQFNGDMAKEALRSYAGATLSGLSFGFTISASLCTLKALLANKDNGLFVKVAALIGGHWIHLCPKKVVHLFCIAVFQTSLETVIRSRRNSITNALFTSRYFLQTLVFMTSSWAILQSLQKVNHKVFWFTYPVNKPKADVCSTHKGKCVKHCMQLMLKNFLIGGALDIFKHMSSMRKNAKINFSMASFLVAYSGIYRVSFFCLLFQVCGWFVFYVHEDRLRKIFVVKIITRNESNGCLLCIFRWNFDLRELLSFANLLISLS